MITRDLAMRAIALLEREANSAVLLEEWTAKIMLCKSPEDLKAIGKQITPQLKSQMLPQDVTKLREKYQDKEGALSGATRREPADA